MSHEPSPAAEEAAAVYDPLDRDLQRLGGSARSGWSQVSSHTALLLLTGIALGPQGLAVLTPSILELLQPVVPVALAVFGVTAVLGAATHGMPSPRPAALPSVLIVVVGATLVMQQNGAGGLLAVTQAAAIAVLLAGAGWVLCSRGTGDDERRVFSIATLLLLGGVADYLSVSALLLGWVAASAWRLARTTGLDNVRLDVEYVEHPLTALLLVTAGARVVFSWEIATISAIAIAVLLIVARLLRKRLGSGTASMAPAPFAVALVMDASRVDPRLTVLLSIVALSALALDVFRGTASEAPA